MQLQKVTKPVAIYVKYARILASTKVTAVVPAPVVHIHVGWTGKTTKKHGNLWKINLKAAAIRCFFV